MSCLLSSAILYISPNSPPLHTLIPPIQRRPHLASCSRPTLTNYPVGFISIAFMSFPAEVLLRSHAAPTPTGPASARAETVFVHVSLFKKNFGGGPAGQGGNLPTGDLGCGFKFNSRGTLFKPKKLLPRHLEFSALLISLGGVLFLLWVPWGTGDLHLPKQASALPGLSFSLAGGPINSLATLRPGILHWEANISAAFYPGWLPFPCLPCFSHLEGVPL